MAKATLEGLDDHAGLPRRDRLNSDGISFRQVRSPEAPNRTNVAGCTSTLCRSYFWVHVCAGVAWILLAVLMLLRPASGETRAHGSLLDSFTDNLRYIRANEVFFRVITVALLHATLAMGFIHVLPVFAKLLQVDSRGLGILASAAGIGALIGFMSYSKLQARISWRNLVVGALTFYNLSLIGLAVIYLGVLWQRREKELSKKLRALPANTNQNSFGSALPHTCANFRSKNSRKSPMKSARC